MCKEYYMFFDKEKLPIAVFVVETAQDAITLFQKIYKKTWHELVEVDGISLCREVDVPAEDWHRIGRKFKKVPFTMNTKLEPKTDPHLIEQVAAMRYARECYLESVQHGRSD